MKNIFYSLALVVLCFACQEESVEPLSLNPPVGVDTLTVKIDTAFLEAKYAKGWQHIKRVVDGVNDPRNACQLGQSYNYTRNYRYQVYSLPDSPCQNEMLDLPFTVKGDSLILGDGSFKAQHRLILKLTADTLRVTFANEEIDTTGSVTSKVVIVDTFVPHK